VNKLSSLIVLLAPLVACSSDPGSGVDPGDGAEVDAGTFVVDPPSPVDPDLGCTNQPVGTIAVDPIVLGGTVAGLTLGGPAPVDAADVTLFVAGAPTVLARTQSAAGGAFSTGNVASGGHPLHAYLKATKVDYRTSFFYPAVPFAQNAANVVVPAISDADFEAVKTALGATQDDRHNGVLLVAVMDCAGAPLPGATLRVHRGNSPNSVGHAYELGGIIPSAKGVYMVFDVPDGKVVVSASYNGTMLPEHDVMVRSTDPDCVTSKGTLTSTIVRP
jgi:hypothetical protein